MKYRVRAWVYVVLFIALQRCCMYDYITHLCPRERAWINHYNVGDTAYFISPKGDVDTMVIIKTGIYNSLNPFVDPWYKYQLDGTYDACGHVDYYVRHRKDSLYGYFLISKEFLNKLMLYPRFADRSGSDINLQNIQEETVTAGGITYPDALVFDDNFTELRDNPKYEIKSYTWSKSVGLVQYVFGDGTAYNRVPDERTKQNQN